MALQPVVLENIEHDEDRPPPQPCAPTPAAGSADGAEILPQTAAALPEPRQETTLVRHLNNEVKHIRTTPAVEPAAVAPTTFAQEPSITLTIAAQEWHPERGHVWALDAQVQSQKVVTTRTTKFMLDVESEKIISAHVQKLEYVRS